MKWRIPGSDMNGGETAVKCPRCRKTMRREKYKDGYRYICPACNLIIGGKTGGQRPDMEERHGEETSD